MTPCQSVSQGSKSVTVRIRVRPRPTAQQGSALRRPRHYNVPVLRDPSPSVTPCRYYTVGPHGPSLASGSLVSHEARGPPAAPARAAAAARRPPACLLQEAPLTSRVRRDVSCLESLAAFLVLSSQSPSGPAGGAPDGYGLGRGAAGLRGTTPAARARADPHACTGRHRIDCSGPGGATLTARDRATSSRPTGTTPSR